MRVTEIVNSKKDLNDILTQRKSYAIVDNALFIYVANASDANEVEAGLSSEPTSPFHINEFEQYHSIMLRIDEGVPIPMVKSLFKGRLARNLGKLNINKDDKDTLDILMKADDEFAQKILYNQDFCRENAYLVGACLSDRSSKFFEYAFANALDNYQKQVADGNAFILEETNTPLNLVEFAPRHNCIFFVSKENTYWYVDGAYDKRKSVEGLRLEDLVTFDASKQKVVHSAYTLSVPVVTQYSGSINVREKNINYNGMPCLSTRVNELLIKDI